MIKGGAGAPGEDAAQRCRANAGEGGKGLLVHVLRFHQLSYSVFHFYALFLCVVFVFFFEEADRLCRFFAFL